MPSKEEDASPSVVDLVFKFVEHTAVTLVPNPSHRSCRVHNDVQLVALRQPPTSHVHTAAVSVEEWCIETGCSCSPEPTEQLLSTRLPSRPHLFLSHPSIDQLTSRQELQMSPTLSSRDPCHRHASAVSHPPTRTERWAHDAGDDRGGVVGDP